MQKTGRKKTKTKSLAYSEVKLLREVLLCLLQPVQSVLSLQELLHEELHHLLRPSTMIFHTLTMCSYCCTMCSEFVYT